MKKKDTYYASAERTSDDDLKKEINIINNDPVLEGLLLSVSGLLAILDENRQIIALNNSFMDMLGIKNPVKALGLRPGEAVKCIYSKEEPGGCGTSKYCSTCGAAIAIVTSLTENKPVERFCALVVEKNGKNVDMALKVKSHPIVVQKKRILLLFLQDITIQQQRAALERTFFHDIKNMLNGIVGATELLKLGDNNPELAQIISQSTALLQKEIDMQSYLSHDSSITLTKEKEKITISCLVSQLESIFQNHPLKEKREINYITDNKEFEMNTDLAILIRILSNMVTNALEASDEEDVITVSIKADKSETTLSVNNPQVIPTDISRRIFQRNFSTKAEDGRGLGTFSIKLFGEKVLGGKVNFTSDRISGTTFNLILKNS